MAKEEDGTWRTVSGRRIFIKEGQSLSDAMKESGKFNESKELDLDSDLKNNAELDDFIKKIDNIDWHEVSNEEMEFILGEANDIFKNYYKDKDIDMTESHTRAWGKDGDYFQSLYVDDDIRIANHAKTGTKDYYDNDTLIRKIPDVINEINTKYNEKIDFLTEGLKTDMDSDKLFDKFLIRLERFDLKNSYSTRYMENKAEDMVEKFQSGKLIKLPIKKTK